MNEIINHGYGIVTIKNACNVDFANMTERLEKLEKIAIEENFTIVYNDEGNPIHAVNQGGFIYSMELMQASPLRLMSLGEDWYDKFEGDIYKGLMQYIEMFPALLPCLWWKTTGHILSYSKGASLGIHSDNDVNYRFGYAPESQHATRNVVSAIIFLNSHGEDFTGGSMKFPYANVEIFPSAGDLLFFPANYTAAHEITTVDSGKRYSYLAWFAQGSEQPERSVNPQMTPTPTGGQVWLTSVIQDYEEFLVNKYGESEIPEHVALHRSRQKDHGEHEEQ